jgi:hypothetical protein
MSDRCYCLAPPSDGIASGIPKLKAASELLINEIGGERNYGLAKPTEAPHWNGSLFGFLDCPELP